MRSLADAELLTRRYCSLRGLQQVPLYGALVLLSVVETLWEMPLRYAAILRLALVVVTLLGSQMISRYLDRRFGIVDSPASAEWKAIVLIVAFFVLQALLMKDGLRRELVTPFLALMAGYDALRDRGFRKHWLIPAAACVLLSIFFPAATFLPAADNAPSRAALVRLAVLGITCGFASLCDHRLLVRTFDDAPAG